jgi:hypothetical protein
VFLAEAMLQTLFVCLPPAFIHKGLLPFYKADCLDTEFDVAHSQGLLSAEKKETKRKNKYVYRKKFVLYP